MFICNGCDHKAVNRQDLIKHKANKHVGVRLACDQCGYKGTKDTLKYHTWAKHENVIFSCSQCDFKAAWQGNVRKHSLKKHGAIP